MRRADRERDAGFAKQVIDRCSHGVMAISTGTDTPYCLPLTFVRVDNALYFHCAREGLKLDLLANNPRVCVTFVGKDAPGFEAPNNYTTFFQSAIVTGTAAEVTEDEEKIMALRALCERITPSHMTQERFDSAIASSLSVTCIWRIDMDRITGKEKAEK